MTFEEIVPLPAAVEAKARADALLLCDEPCLRATAYERIIAAALLAKRRRWRWVEVGWVARTLAYKRAGADRRREA